jgi:sterol desaturase/sphingolipid hydroxylase (fatty acid hydroxylase superfamily)
MIGMMVTAIITGFVLAEVSVYVWHRFVCHAGLLRRYSKDFFRRRHFHHHVVQYPPARLQTDVYVASCDVAFRAVGILLIMAAAGAVLTRATKPLAATLAVAGMTLHGWLGAKLHELYHLSDDAARRWPPLRFAILFHLFERLRRFHDGHHEAQANYGLMLPVVDAIGGTHHGAGSGSSCRPDELFPDFDPDLSSSCGEAIL